MTLPWVPSGLGLPGWREGLLEQEVTATAWAEGQAWGLEESVAYALGETPAPTPR